MAYELPDAPWIQSAGDDPEFVACLKEDGGCDEAKWVVIDDVEVLCPKCGGVGYVRNPDLIPFRPKPC